MLFASYFYGVHTQLIKMVPYAHTDMVLTGRLLYMPDVGSPKSVWSLDYNGKIFRLRYKSKYLKPSGNTPKKSKSNDPNAMPQPGTNNNLYTGHKGELKNVKLVEGGKMLKEMAKQEALGPLINAMKLNDDFSESSSTSSSSSSSDTKSSKKGNKKGKNGKHVKKAIKKGVEKNGSSNSDLSNSESSSSNSKNSRSSTNSSDDKKDNKNKKDNKDNKKKKKEEKKKQKAKDTIKKNEKKSKDRISEQESAGYNSNVDPVVFSPSSNLLSKFLIKNNIKSFAMKESSTNTVVLTNNEAKKNQEIKNTDKGPGFYWKLIPIFNNGISKKILIKYGDNCLTSNLTLEPCSFTKFWKMSPRFYWNIYPTVNNSQISKISDYLCQVQNSINQGKMIQDVNFDQLLAQQGIYDNVKNFESSSEECEEESSGDCDCEAYCMNLIQGMQPGNMLGGGYPGNSQGNNCVPSHPMGNGNCGNSMNGAISMQNLQNGSGWNSMNLNCCNYMDCTNTMNFFDKKKCKKRR